MAVDKDEPVPTFDAGMDKEQVLAAEIPVGQIVMAADAAFVRVREAFSPEARLVCVDVRHLPFATGSEAA